MALPFPHLSRAHEGRGQGGQRWASLLQRSAEKCAASMWRGTEQQRPPRHCCSNGSGAAGSASPIAPSFRRPMPVGTGEGNSGQDTAVSADLLLLFCRRGTEQRHREAGVRPCCGEAPAPLDLAQTPPPQPREAGAAEDGAPKTRYLQWILPQWRRGGPPQKLRAPSGMKRLRGGLEADPGNLSRACL